MNPSIAALIAARLAAKKNFKVLTTYADGAMKTHETETMGQAENWAIGERRKVGRDLVDRLTGKTVRVVRVSIEAL